jgi:hypothetical protein
VAVGRVQFGNPAIGSRYPNIGEGEQTEKTRKKEKTNCVRSELQTDCVK